MTCYHPIKAWKSVHVSAEGNRLITFNRNDAFTDLPTTLPCGSCIGCRLDRSSQWAIRCCHEASLHDDNCFLTLTYNEENLPYNNSLNVADFQRFMKRLRKHFSTRTIRFFHCGEYGDLNGRPHYHALCFNLDFEDKEPWKKERDHTIYISKVLDKIWGLGFATIGQCSYETAAYCARYVMKKMTGAKTQQHYEWVNPETGVIYDRQPEYATMSRRPGLGQGWYDAFQSDCFPCDHIVHNGRKFKVPRYYDKRLELSDSRALKTIKGKRIQLSKTTAVNSTPARLKVRETVQIARMGSHKRDV